MFRLVLLISALTLMVGVASAGARPVGLEQHRVMADGAECPHAGGSCWPPGSVAPTPGGLLFCACAWYGNVFRCYWIH